jgi:hypothetical protein
VSRSRTASVAGALIALAAITAGCGGSDGGSGPDVTLPSSLSIPATTSSTAGPATTTTVEVPPTNPTGDGAPIIVSVKAEPGADTCTAGSIPALVTFEVEPQPPVRVFSVFLDGAPAISSGTPGVLTIERVPCDGAIHTVLFIATGTDGQSSTQAVAFRAPRTS